MEKVKGFKGMNPDMTCRNFKYEVGHKYKTDKVELCSSGFHFCVFPFDVFDYYPPCSSKKGINRFFKVTGSGKIDSDGEKTCCEEIEIVEEIGLHGIIEEGIKSILSHVKSDINSAATNTGNRSAATNTGYQSAATNTGYQSAATNTGYQSAATNTGNCSAATNTGDRSAATNTGNCSAATNTGDRSAATNTGNCSAATNTGNCSAATNTGYQSAATNTGYQSAATNTGNCSAATNTGNCSAATNTGDRSAATNTGNRSAASVEGKESIAIVTGKDSKAKGVLGCWIVLTERGDFDNVTYPIKEVKAFKVDGVNIKADTYYKLIDGEAVMVG